GFLAALQAGITSRGELVLELLDTSGRVDELQLARVERMASAADVDFQLGTGAAGDKRIATAALNLRHEVLGMDVVFHSFHLNHCRPAGQGPAAVLRLAIPSKKAN